MPTAQEQVDRVKTALGQLENRDADGFVNLFSDDVVFQISGSGPLSGAYRGRDTVRALVKGFVAVMGPTYRLDPVDILADERYVVMMFHTMGERDEMVLDVMTSCFAASGEDGRWNRCWWVASDQAAYDAYFS